MNTRIGQLTVQYSARRIPSYSLELWHDGLKKHRLLRASDEALIRRKAELQIAEWEQRWLVSSEREQERADRVQDKRNIDKNKSTAVTRSVQAQKELDELGSLLKFALSVNDAIDWESLKDKAPFLENKPSPSKPPAEPTPLPRPREPQRDDWAYVPQLGFLDKLFGTRRAERIAAKQAHFDADHANWKREVTQREQSDLITRQAFERDLQQQQQQYQSAIAAWEARKSDYISKQNAANAVVDERRNAYLARLPEAIVEYCDLVLSGSKYPNCFPQEFDLDYESSAKLLIINYRLPAPDDLPTLKSIKYVATRDQPEEQHIPALQSAKLYDNVLYQVVLRTIHEIIEADTVQAIDSVVLNGIVTSIDRSTGKPVTACVLSLRSSRNEFLAIDLAHVEPKTCFKALKGVGSSKLHGLSPVPPIMQLRREDGRFIAAYEVANSLDASTNLAAMDWEDFEHLIREVFEKEFSVNGGEVKVTQASRDGGVDAVAFDPDPIRGGKIVIQAKRYINTVGVGAVRDLYGTVLNEGANKGILVTTSDYGPDSYAFANGKPLVLLSGANLLHILEKHGHRARIDIAEARRLREQG